MQRQVLAALLMACTMMMLVNCASVGVVRVPRVYNVLIRSDGALAPSEAVSADSIQKPSPKNTPAAAASAGGSSATDGDNAQDDTEEADAGDQQDDQQEEEPLPVLDPKTGAIQDGVNYTAVPLSRAYPLTRYTAPIIAAHYPLSYLSPLHGGLILGPVPRLPAALQDQQPQEQQQQQAYQQTQQQQQQDYQQQQQVYQQQQIYQQQQQPSEQQAPREPRPELRSASLPQGAFDDYDRESVAVEAEEQN